MAACFPRPGSVHSPPDLGQSSPVVIKAGAATPKMFAVSALYFFYFFFTSEVFLILSWLSQSRNYFTFFPNVLNVRQLILITCEGSVRQQLFWQSVRDAVCSDLTAVKHWTWCETSAPILGESSTAAHGFILLPCTVSSHFVYLKNVVSHITTLSRCNIMSLESVAQSSHCFIPTLEVEQTPVGTVAPGQPVLQLDDVFNSLPNRAPAIPILSPDGNFGSPNEFNKSTITCLLTRTLHFPVKNKHLREKVAPNHGCQIHVQQGATSAMGRS